MPALNFKTQFAEKVESREKRQTIRALRKDGRDTKTGDTLYFYTGMRTKSCRKLGAARAGGVYDIRIYQNRSVILSGVLLSHDQVKELAIADGFPCKDDFIDFFETTHGLPFKGKLIKW